MADTNVTGVLQDTSLVVENLSRRYMEVEAVSLYVDDKIRTEELTPTLSLPPSSRHSITIRDHDFPKPLETLAGVTMREARQKVVRYCLAMKYRTDGQHGSAFAEQTYTSDQLDPPE